MSMLIKSVQRFVEFDIDKASQCSLAAHAFTRLAVPAQSGRELSLAFAMAAQCGVVERALNK